MSYRKPSYLHAGAQMSIECAATEGASLRVFPVNEEMTDEDRAALERAVEEGAEDFERGDFENAREFAVRLAANA